jgi:phosphoserine aminotransferase
MNRVYNFSGGPAMIPESVLRQAADEMLDWRGHGMNVMEMSHRSKEFIDIAAEAEADLRELMGVPLNYKVLFLQGGASGQFAAIPMNITKSGDKADYAITGSWSKKSASEAKKYLEVNIAVKTDAHTHVPNFEDWEFSKNAKYVHITPNETIHGVTYSKYPDTGEIPLVADFSSMILSQPIDVSKFGVIYAGAQKNIGPAGIAVVIVREDLLGQARDDTPSVWHWANKAESGSMVNTPPTYSWYLAGLVFKWLKQQGGVEAIYEMNKSKAKKLYSSIDESDFYTNPVEPEYRSLMNIPFTIAKPELEKQFMEEAGKAGLKNLEGHRSIGGMRASLYNAMPEAGVNALVKFMKEFEKQYA